MSDDKLDEASDESTYWEHFNENVNDRALNALIRSAARTGAGFDVTLTVGGSLISGVLVNRIAWLDALKESLGETVLEAFRESWETLIEDIRASQPDDEMPEYDAMVHLRDAQWFGSNERGLPTSGGMCWRAPQTQIQGWALGRLSVDYADRVTD